MGIYFDSTTPEEDAKYILDGIEDGILTKDYYLIKDYETEKKEEHLVWISLTDTRKHLLSEYNKEIVILNNIEGILTKTGISYIQRCLMNSARYSASY